MEPTEPETVGAEGPHQPHPPPPPPGIILESADETKTAVAAFAARRGRTLTDPTAAAPDDVEEEDSFDARMKTAADDDDDDEEDDEKEQKICCCCTVIDEAAPFRRRWDMIQVVALLYVALLVPMRTGFAIELEPLTPEWWLELAVDVYFILDLVLNFMTSFFDHDAVLVRAPREIAVHYAKGWMLIDVISCLPISYITLIIQAAKDSTEQGSPPDTKVFKILRLLRLAKLLRLGRLKKIVKRYEEEIDNLLGVLKLAGAVTVMMYVCHIFACFWYFVGEDEGELDGWITGQMPIWAPGAIGEDGQGPSPDDVSLMTRYVTAYYWAITTISTVGFGDITAQTTTERVFAIMAEMFGSLMFAVLIGMTGSMMVGQKLLEEKVASQIAELREFMEAKRIPKYLRVKIRKFMETLYEEKSGFDEKQVLAQLPPAMAQDLLHHMYKKLLVDVPMFKKVEEGAITMLCSLIKPYTAMQGDPIYKQGEVGREVYVIMQGIVEITFEDGDQEEIEKGQTFGEGCLRQLLRKNSVSKSAADLEPQKREDTAVALSDTDLKFLTLTDLQAVFDDYPLVRKTMTEIYADMNKRRAKRAKGELWGLARRQSVVGTGSSMKDIQGYPKLMGFVHDVMNDPPGNSSPLSKSEGSPQLPMSTGSTDSSAVDATALSKVEMRIEALEEGLGARIDGLAATIQTLISAMDVEVGTGKLDQTRNPSAITQP